MSKRHTGHRSLTVPDRHERLVAAATRVDQRILGRIRSEMAARGIGMAGFAEMVGTSRQNIYRLMGQPTHKRQLITLVTWATALGLRVRIVLEEKPKPAPPPPRLATPPTDSRIIHKKPGSHHAG